MILRYGLKQFFWYPPKIMKFWPKKRTFLLKQWIPFLCFCELPTSVTFNFTFLSRVLRNLFCSYQVRHHQPTKRIIITHTSLQYPFPVQLASILLESVFFYSTSYCPPSHHLISHVLGRITNLITSFCSSKLHIYIPAYVYTGSWNSNLRWNIVYKMQNNS